MSIVAHQFGRVCYYKDGRWTYKRDGVPITCPESHPTDEVVELDEAIIGG